MNRNVASVMILAPFTNRSCRWNYGYSILYVILLNDGSEVRTVPEGMDSDSFFTCMALGHYRIPYRQAFEIRGVL